MLREGSRYRDFAEIILAGYDLQLQQMDRPDSALLQEFESTKKSCILPLLSMGYVNFAFALSRKYMCFLGLVMSFEYSDGDESLIRDFSAVIHDNFAVSCSFSDGEHVSLGAYVLDYLFQHKKLAQMMHICRQLPESSRSEFMKDYLPLQWIQSLDKLDCKSAAIQSAAYAATSTQLSASVTISLSKLCAKAGNLDAPQTAEIERQYTYIFALKQLTKLDPTFSHGCDSSLDLLNTIIRKLRTISEDSTVILDKLSAEDLLSSCGDILKQSFAAGELNAETLLGMLLDIIEVVASLEMSKWADSALEFSRGPPLTSDLRALHGTLLEVIVRGSVDIRITGQPHPLRNLDLQGKVRDRLNHLIDSGTLEFIVAYIAAYEIRFDID